MLILNDFRCKAGHTTELLRPHDLWEEKCPECGKPAKRLIAPVRCKLDHTFPGESVKWAKLHEKEAKIDSDNKGIAHV